MLDTVSDNVALPLENESENSGVKGVSIVQQKKYNTSMDFDRHKITSPRKGKKGDVKGKENSDVYGDSCATLGESFMGESFANLSMSVLALDNYLDDDDSEYDDNDGDNLLESIVSHQITQKSRLDSIVDFEDDEDDHKSSD